MECIICGNESATGFHMDPFLCSGRCYKEATEVYVTVEPNDAMRGVFPLIEGINAHAENFGGCRGENWQEVLAHAHVEAGYICVRGPVKELFDERGRPTSLLLHEYAHLQVQGGHTEDFWVTTKQLHSEFGVMHRRREQALGSIFGSVCLTGLGLSLWLVFGWGWIGIGPLLGLIVTVPAAMNSFRTERIETFERECGTPEDVT